MKARCSKLPSKVTTLTNAALDAISSSNGLPLGNILQGILQELTSYRKRIVRNGIGAIPQRNNMEIATIVLLMGQTGMNADFDVIVAKCFDNNVFVCCR